MRDRPAGAPNGRGRAPGRPAAERGCSPLTALALVSAGTEAERPRRCRGDPPARRGAPAPSPAGAALPGPHVIRQRGAAIVPGGGSASVPGRERPDPAGRDGTGLPPLRGREALPAAAMAFAKAPKDPFGTAVGSLVGE